MKKKKYSIIVFISILYFSLIFQETNTLFNEQDAKASRNIRSSSSASNSFEVDWYRTWGGRFEDRGNGIAVDSLDNVYLAGEAYGFGAGGTDLVLVKYNSSGVQQWNRTWGGSYHDNGHGVAVDSSENIYLSGTTYSFGAGGTDLVLIKYDSSGVQQWNRTWGGTENDIAFGVAVDSSDNVYVTGYTSSYGVGGKDVILLKYNSSGGLQWNKTWGFGGYDEGHGVAVDSSDNVYLAGETVFYEPWVEDMVLVKYNSSGDLQWSRIWGGRDWDVGFGVAIDSFDNVYLAGDTYSVVVGENDMVLVKYNSSGGLQWSRIWGGIYSDESHGVTVSSSDDIYITGYTTNSDVGEPDMVLVKYSSSGVQQWSRIWGGTSKELGNGVAVDSSENIYLSGTTYSFGMENGDMVLVKYGVENTIKKREPVIPGYPLLLLISVICVITAIYLKKKLK